MRIRPWLIVLLALVLAGCGGAPVKKDSASTLATAETVVAQATNNPKVAQHAPVELKEAQRTLDSAKHADNRTTANHLAYLAMRRAQIAQASAKESMAENSIEQALNQQQKLVHKARARQMEELRQKLSGLHPRQTGQGMVLTLSNVLFAVNSSQLDASAMQPLDKLASFLKEHPSDRVRIAGYTDNSGSATYNRQLSKERAEAVQSAMVQRGINPSRMTAVGHGEQNPVASNQTKSGRQQNRRVEFTILSNQQREVELPGGAGTSSSSTPSAAPSPAMPHSAAGGGLITLPLGQLR